MGIPLHSNSVYYCYYYTEYKGVTRNCMYLVLSPALSKVVSRMFIPTLLVGVRSYCLRLILTAAIARIHKRQPKSIENVKIALFRNL
jgi:hypothetical protein